MRDWFFPGGAAWSRAFVRPGVQVLQRSLPAEPGCTCSAEQVVTEPDAYVAAPFPIGGKGDGGGIVLEAAEPAERFPDVEKHWLRCLFFPPLSSGNPNLS